MDMEQRVRELRPKIVESVKEPMLLTQLLSSSVITEKDHSRVKTMMQNDPFKANEEMMDCVLKSEHPGKWKAFMDALQGTGYEDIYRSLMSPNDNNDEIVAYIRKLIQKFTKELAYKLPCMEITTRLYSKGVINDVDRENISCDVTNKGDSHGNLTLLDRMKCRVSPRKWYIEFLQALVEVGCDYLVRKMEPEFILNKQKFIKMLGADAIPNQTSEGFQFVGSSQASGSRHTTDCYQENMVTLENFVTDDGEGEMECDDLAPPPVPPRSCSLEESSFRQPESGGYNLNVNVTEQYDKTTKKINVEVSDDENMPTDEDNNSSDSDSMVSDYEGKEENCRESASTYQVRSYQVELAEIAIQGTNTIICSETGTGKTWVALEIIKRHLEKPSKKGPRKVAIMARTSLMMKQQADRIGKYLPMYKTKLLTGENEDSKQLIIYMELYDVLCFTPQILVNNLEISAVKSLSEFSLLILDECHHTRGDEPYNRLMRKYLVEKEKGMKNLPQVVGLTASIGVGKSRTDDEAVDYILRVMACLDVTFLSTVKNNIEALKKHVNLPEQERIPLQKPDNDPCKDILIIGIEETEDLLEENGFFQPNIIDMITEAKPSDKESQVYNKWTVDLFQTAQQKVDDFGASRDICACARYLNTYNSALEINKLLRYKDVIKFLAEKHQQDNLSREKHTNMEKELFKNFFDIQKKLNIKGKTTENPNVRTLCDTLKKALDSKGEDSRALVFVKARATCKAVAEFLDKDIGKNGGYRTSPLYGKEDRGGDEGMTENKQATILQKFRDGAYKVLVCTSIGNEGIDVPQCNIVLSYDYSGNEITKIQMQGRARQKNATVTLMAGEDLLEQDRINAYKVSMMYRALKKIDDLETRYIRMKTKLFQKEEINKYHYKVNTENFKKLRKSDDDHDILCGRCNIFLCYVSNVREMGSHNVVIDQDFPNKVYRREHKKTTYFGGVHNKYMIYCNDCGHELGIVGIYNGLDHHLLKIRNMKFRNHLTQEIHVYKKWLDLPYRVVPYTPADLQCNKQGNQM
ncbi:Caspase recruitment domain [Mactra antiquata]